jgi:hypothetical protein
MQLVKGLALSGSLSSLWLTCFGLFACLDFGPCLFCFFSLSCLGALKKKKFGKVSSKGCWVKSGSKTG